MNELELNGSDELAVLTGWSKVDLERQFLLEQIRERRALAARAEFEALHAAQIIEDEAASSERNQTIYFPTTIDEMSVSELMSVTQRWHRREPGKLITIKLNSPGGYVSETLALYDHLRMLSAEGTPIKTVGVGTIASGAGIIFQAGDSRLMTPNAFMLIHEAAGGLRGKSSSMSDDLAFIQRQQKKMLAIYTLRSKLTVEEIEQRWTGKEWWLDAGEAVELGLADGMA